MAATQPVDQAARERPSWAVLMGSVCLLLLAVFLVYTGLLVRLANDHEGRSILPPTVGAGDTVSGTVKLTNAGLLPVQVYLEPRTGAGLQDTDLPSGISVTVSRVSDGEFLYQGPMAASMGPLEVIYPGQTSELKLSIRSEDNQGTAAVPVNFTYFWAARPALPWWWWAPTALVILLIVAAGYRRSRRAAG